MTVAETEAALKLLEHAKDEIVKRNDKRKLPQHTDYGFLTRLAQASLYQGRPAVDVSVLYEKMRETAADRQLRLDRHCDLLTCDAVKRHTVKAMRNRHRAAEIFAMNEFVYAASEDLARGIESASILESKVQAYALALKEVIEEKDLLRTLGLEDGRYDMLDTYAYAQLVLEARKRDRDIAVFRRMRRILQDVVAAFEKRANKEPHRKNYLALNAARLHLQSARELSGE